MMKPDSLYNCGMKPLVYSEGIAKNKSKTILREYSFSQHLSRDWMA